MKSCNLLAAILSITLASCSSDSAREDRAASSGGRSINSNWQTGTIKPMCLRIYTLPLRPTR
jgi:hypothetical protein